MCCNLWVFPFFSTKKDEIDVFYRILTYLSEDRVKYPLTSTFTPSVTNSNIDTKKNSLTRKEIGKIVLYPFIFFVNRIIQHKITMIERNQMCKPVN